MRKFLLSGIALLALASPALALERCEDVTKGDIIAMTSRSPSVLIADAIPLEVLDIQAIGYRCFARVITTAQSGMLKYYLDPRNSEVIRFTFELSPYYTAVDCHGNQETRSALPACTTSPLETPRATPLPEYNAIKELTKACLRHRPKEEC